MRKPTYNYPCLYGFTAAEAINKTAQKLFNDDAFQLATAMKTTLDLAAGAQEFLAKPYTAADLLNTLSELIGKKLQ